LVILQYLYGTRTVHLVEKIILQTIEFRIMHVNADNKIFSFEEGNYAGSYVQCKRESFEE
jgi:hypothetical protein